MTGIQLERVTLLESLANRLEQRIVSGEFKPGHKLPGEASIADEWGVSRPVVREALALLRERGYVATVNGSGTFVRYPDVGHVAAVLERHMRLTEADRLTVDHLYEARQAIEVTAAQLAATHVDQSDFDDLQRLLADMERGHADAIRYAAADVGFHVAVARASKNPLLPALLTPLVSMIVEGVMKSHHAPRGVALGLEGHSNILKQLSLADADGAAAAMRRHLEDSRQLFPHDVLLRASTGGSTRRYRSTGR